MPSSRNGPDAPQTLDLAWSFGADRHLQAEIDTALAGLAEGLPSLLGLRLARVLSTVLEPSWSEHTSFQDEALFPILARAADAAPGTRPLLDRLGREHAEICACHHKVILFLNDLIIGRPAVAAPLSASLMQALQLRRRHHEAEAALGPLIPAVLDASDQAKLDHWASGRTAAFPMNLLNEIWD